MKKFENLGKHLDKQEQKAITGGTFYNLYCKYNYGDPFVIIASYGSINDCYTDRNTVCISLYCWESYCTGDQHTCAA